MKPKALFRNLPIQRKLLLITLTICAAVLFIAVTALFAFQIWSFRANFKRDIAALSTIIANNSTAALTFVDRKAGAEIISSLKLKSTIQGAYLADQNGRVVASFGMRNVQWEITQFPGARHFQFLDGDLLYTEPVELEGRRIGMLYLRTDYRSVLWQLIRFYLFISVIVLGFSALLAWWMSDRLGRLITNPLLNLAETARFVGEKNDYSVRSRVHDSRDEIGLLAVAFNNMLERIQSQGAALNLSQQKTESLINSIDGIVWEWNALTLEFTYVSQQSLQILGYPPAVCLGNRMFRRQLVHPDDVEKATKTILEAIARQQPYQHEYRMLAADRRVVWVRESGGFVMEHGQVVALRGILQDITEQKNAAGELEQLNRQLMDACRQAGMAEVATGVLHNVGNVLNSVNVSATLLHEQIEKSKLQLLQQATGLLREHVSELPQYLTTDAKGRLLPEFIIKVSDAMKNEQGRWREELTGLKKNIEHMKEIVAMQQSYAKVSGVMEQLEAKDLVEDALRINSAGIVRHRVDITREFLPVPKIKVDKHKVMQILINLIRNAKYAVDENPPDQKLLKIQIAMSSLDRVKIVVQDNGVGIPKENLTRIFGHGFTTKSDGHGFGLHSGALAAKEIGGSLLAASEGPGKGASFTLELPVANLNN